MARTAVTASTRPAALKAEIPRSLASRAGPGRGILGAALALAAELGASVLDFVYPPVCWACGRGLETAAAHLCPSCWRSVLSGVRAPARCRLCGCPAPVPLARCANCVHWDAPPVDTDLPGTDALPSDGLPTDAMDIEAGPTDTMDTGFGNKDPGPPPPPRPTATPAGNLAPGTRVGEPRHFQRALVLGPFDGPMQRAIHALKFRSCRSLGQVLGYRMGVELHEALAPVELLIPVPLHAARQRQRGYNQSLCIAIGLGRALGVPVVAKVLRRCRPTRQQARLDARSRARNLAHAFSLAGPVPAARCIGLVDDVLTTGSTVNACARVLCQGGAPQVWALTLASRFRREALAWRGEEMLPEMAAAGCGSVPVPDDGSRPIC